MRLTRLDGRSGVTSLMHPGRHGKPGLGNGPRHRATCEQGSARGIPGAGRPLRLVPSSHSAPRLHPLRSGRFRVSEFHESVPPRRRRPQSVRLQERGPLPVVRRRLPGRLPPPRTGIHEAVAQRPAVFLTPTAPGFGAVHVVKADSLIAQQGVPVSAAAAALGHDPAIFLRTYAHLYPGDLRGVADAMDVARQSAREGAVRLPTGHMSRGDFAGTNRPAEFPDET